MSDNESRSRVTKYGYREVLVIDLPPDHPYAATGAWNFPWIPEAKVVAAEILGRMLKDDEVIHHKNGDRLDNTPANLEVMDKDEHTALHAASRPKGKKESTLLIELAETRGIELFHDAAGSTFATVRTADHRETWSTESALFDRWLRELYFRETEVAIGNDGLRDALATLSARATFDGAEHEVHIRIGYHDGRLYLDMCDERWRAIEVDRDGWRIVDDPPVRFTRSPDMLALPEPIHEPGSGAVYELRDLLNISDDDFLLALSWVVGCFNPQAPYVVIAIAGEHGTGKTSLSSALRSLIDPADPALISPPRDEENLMTIASSAWVMAFDNMSFLTNEMSDALARLAYGGAFKRVKKYTHDVITFKAARPVLLNGISDIVTRPDLQDRLINLYLPRIETYVEDRVVQERLDQLRPRVLGAILSSIAFGMVLQELRTTAGEPAIETPSTRMKTAVRWMALAAVRLFGKDDAGAEFSRIFEENKARAVFIALDDSPLTSAVRLISETGGFGHEADPRKNTVGALWDEIRRTAAAHEKASRRFPSSARGLGSELRRLAPSLRDAFGIEVEFVPRTKHGYLVRISATDAGERDERGERRRRTRRNAP